MLQLLFWSGPTMEHEQGKHKGTVEAIAITHDLAHLREFYAELFQVVDNLTILSPDVDGVGRGCYGRRDLFLSMRDEIFQGTYAYVRYTEKLAIIHDCS